MSEIRDLLTQASLSDLATQEILEKLRLGTELLLEKVELLESELADLKTKLGQ